MTENKFRFAKKAGLFTWNGDFTAEDFKALIERVTTMWGEIENASLAMELNEAGNIHFHAFVVWPYVKDVEGDYFKFKDNAPNIKPNVGGKNMDQGHYYCQAPKKGKVDDHLHNIHRLIPKKKWVINLWTEGKMAKDSVCTEAQRGKFFTPQFKMHVECERTGKKKRKLEAFLAEEIASLNESAYEYKAVPEWDWYKALVATPAKRTPVLVVWGKTMLGKSEWARSVMPKAHVMSKAPTWGQYDWYKNDGIIFEEFTEPLRYMINNKELVQGKPAMVATGQSATNCYVKDVCTYKKPRVFLTNDDMVLAARELPLLEQEWVTENVIFVHVTDRMWIDPRSGEDAI